MKVTGTIVAVGIASEECSGYSLHFTSAVLLLADGSHKERALESLVVDPAQAAARLKGEAAAPVVRAVVRYTPDKDFPIPPLEKRIGQQVAVLRVDRNNTALCLPMEGGPIFTIALTYLEVAPGTDASDVRALLQS